jgi:hypothetical protein
MSEILSRHLTRDDRPGTTLSIALYSFLAAVRHSCRATLQGGRRRICAADAKKRGKPLLDQPLEGRKRSTMAAVFRPELSCVTLSPSVSFARPLLALQ